MPSHYDILLREFRTATESYEDARRDYNVAIGTQNELKKENTMFDARKAMEETQARLLQYEEGGKIDKIRKTIVENRNRLDRESGFRQTGLRTIKATFEIRTKNGIKVVESSANLKTTYEAGERLKGAGRFSLSALAEELHKDKKIVSAELSFLRKVGADFPKAKQHRGYTGPMVKVRGSTGKEFEISPRMADFIRIAQSKMHTQDYTFKGIAEELGVAVGRARFMYLELKKKGIILPQPVSKLYSNRLMVVEEGKKKFYNPQRAVKKIAEKGEGLGRFLEGRGFPVRRKK
jgi:hypothetical protein